MIGDESKYTPVEADYFYNIDVPDGEGGTTREPVWVAGSDINDIGPLSALLLNDGFDSWPDEQETFDQSSNRRASNPAVAAAAYLDDRFEEAGIVITRSARDGEAPSTAERETLAVVDSPDLDQIIATSLVDATTAEMLLKEYGVRAGTDSERINAVFALVTGGFVSAGLPYSPIDGTNYHDGSGRSALNRTNCEMIHATIADRAGVGASIITPAAQSPVAACASGPGVMYVMASVSDTATGLTGWYDAPNGERLTFTMLAEDPTRLETPPDDPEAEPAGRSRTAVRRHDTRGELPPVRLIEQLAPLDRADDDRRTVSWPRRGYELPMFPLEHPVVRDRSSRSCSLSRAISRWRRTSVRRRRRSLASSGSSGGERSVARMSGATSRSWPECSNSGSFPMVG